MWGIRLHACCDNGASTVATLFVDKQTAGDSEELYPAVLIPTHSVWGD